MKSVLNAHTSPARPSAQPAPLCLTPTLQLVSVLRDNPLALGLLCLIKRLYLIHKQPVPLSASDIAAYDPLASPSAVRRAIRRLAAAGGVIIHEGRGSKQRFVPAWGRIAGGVRLWDLGRKLYNRPAHLAVLRFDPRIFDYFLGRLILDGRLGATVDRYVSAPLLSLSDVGAYLALQGGFAIKPRQMDQLGRCGLIRDGKPCDLPANGDDILRWITQRQLLRDDAPVLVEKGLRRLGLAQDTPAPVAATGGQPLVYFPPGQLAQTPPVAPSQAGCLAGNRSGLDPLKTVEKAGDSSAPEADNPQPARNAPDMTWNLKHLIHDPTLPSQVAGFDQKKSKRRKNQPKDPLPETPTAALLQTLGTRPSVIRELCHISLEHATRIVAYGRSRADVRSLAGWVVSALRDHRDQGWLPPEPPSPNRDLLDPARLAASPDIGLFIRSEPVQPDEVPAVEAPALRHTAPADVLMDWLRRTLGRMLRREDCAVIGRMSLLDAGDAPLFGCASPEDLRRAEDGLAHCVKTVCQEFGWEQAPRFVLAADQPPRGEADSAATRFA